LPLVEAKVQKPNTVTLSENRTYHVYYVILNDGELYAECSP